MAEIYSFGAWVRRRRRALDLTQIELAGRVGCAESMLRKIEADARRPSKQIAERLAAALELPEAERGTFLKAARAELTVDRLAVPSTRALFQAEALSALPFGTVAFLHTEIEGSATLWEREPERMSSALARHNAILLATIAAHGGHLYKTTGDGVQAAFVFLAAALAAALAIQRAILAEPWGTSPPIRIRIGLHIGPAVAEGTDYTTSSTLNRLAHVMAAGNGGQILLSQEMADLVRHELPPNVELRDLGPQRMKGLTHLQHLFQVVAPGLPAEFSRLATGVLQQPSLPTPATPLIGREHEVARVCTLLQRPGLRLLTITGPGGMGKTRLGFQVAAELADIFADGVYVVPLAPITEPSLVIPTIAQVLGVSDSGEWPVHETLYHFLSERQILLVLDNFEQVLRAAPEVAALLAAAPRVSLLVTSRVPLRLGGEHEYPLGPLALSSDAEVSGDRVPGDGASLAPAVRLFVERAQAVRPDFSLSDTNHMAVEAICGRLDGLPLAIELAAARVRIFSPPALLERLASVGGLPLLTGGSRDLPARQQTIRAAIDWSYQLLPSAEQQLLARFGVLVGGFTISAAEVVAGESVLAELDVLVQHSLVHVLGEVEGEPRFGMLETVREYALEQLAVSGQADAVRSGHTAYFLALAEQAEPELSGAAQETWLRRLDVEHDNLRAALQWSLTSGAKLQALRLSGALWRFWRMRGHNTEGRNWLETTLTTTTDAGAAGKALLAARARALVGACTMAHYQGDYSRAASFGGEALALARRLGDKRAIAAALQGLALVARSGGNYAAACAMYQEGLAISREFGDLAGTAFALCRIGVVHLFASNWAAARPALEESLVLYRQVGDQEGIGIAIHCLGYISWGEGDTTTAWRMLSEALEIFKGLGSRRYIAHSLSMLGRVALDEQNTVVARTLIEQGLELIEELGDRLETAKALDALAQAAVQLGMPTWSARLMGASRRVFASLGSSITEPLYQTLYERTRSATQALLSEEAFTRAWEEGLGMTPTQAIAANQAQPELLQRARGAPETLALTARELEVLHLVAQGLSDAQVAERLIVSQRTVHAHLRSIYTKLDVPSRTAAVRYALDYGLL